jgi:membrane-associated protease RseP (regulator of RpoE activity)
MKTAKLTLTIIGAALAALGAALPATQAAPSPEKVAYLGVGVAPVDETLRDQLKLGRGVGLRVREVVADSPAQKASVKAHDILEKLNDQLLFNGEQLASLVRSYEPGQKVTLAVIRQGDRQNLEISLGETELKEMHKPLFEGLDIPHEKLLRVETIVDDALKGVYEKLGGERLPTKPTTFLGVELASVEPALAAQLELDKELGALVSMVLENSPAEKAGLKKHDVILKLDGKTLKGPGDFSERVRDHKKGDKVALELMRGGKPVEVEATLSEQAPPEPSKWRNLLKEFRYVPRIKVIKTPEAKGGAVIHLESDDVAGDQLEHRVLVHSVEPGKAGRVRVIAPPAGKPGPAFRKNRVMVIKNDEGVTTVKDEDGKRFVTVKDPKGKMIFEGPVASAEDKQKLPPGVRECLEKLEEDVAGEPTLPGEESVQELQLAPSKFAPDII